MSFLVTKLYNYSNMLQFGTVTFSQTNIEDINYANYELLQFKLIN
jgi:hypothetical protein